MLLFSANSFRMSIYAMVGLPKAKYSEAVTLVREICIVLPAAGAKANLPMFAMLRGMFS